MHVYMCVCCVCPLSHPHLPTSGWLLADACSPTHPPPPSPPSPPSRIPTSPLGTTPPFPRHGLDMGTDHGVAGGASYFPLIMQHKNGSPSRPSAADLAWLERACRAAALITGAIEGDPSYNVVRRMRAEATITVRRGVTGGVTGGVGAGGEGKGGAESDTSFDEVLTVRASPVLLKEEVTQLMGDMRNSSGE